MAEVGTGKHSYFALLLSLLIPGLGQIYLRKPGKMLLILIGVVTGLLIVYANSIPVMTWTDMKPQIKASDQNNVEERTVWTLKDGRQLRFRPRRTFQLSGWAQVLFFWMYGVVDGWAGRRGYRRPKTPEPVET